MKRLLCLLLFIPALNANEIPKNAIHSHLTQHVFLVTIDGLRWQEVFRGVSPDLVENQDFVKSASLKDHFWEETPSKRAEKLMPFFWNTIAKQGIVWGNRDSNSFAQVSNYFYFSYPGYSEILSGYADPRIISNKKVWNPSTTVLEWFNNQPEFHGKVEAFASWDVFPYIINTKRSGIPVNAGFMKATGDKLTPLEKHLNLLQDEIPSPWHNVRLDAFTHHYALESIKKNHPRLVYISYGETDDFAHDGRYDHYIEATHRTDAFIAALWETIQADPVYQNKTTLILTTDHGRGEQPLETWQHHASQRGVKGYLSYLEEYDQGIIGSDHIWIAVMGPDTSPKGVLKNIAPVSQNQIAATVAAALGKNFNTFQKRAGLPLPGAINND